MCLATPGRIVEISSDDPAFPVARVDFGPVTRPAQLVYVPDARVGDYVIVQAGFAIRRLSAAEAEESLRYVRELAKAAAATMPPVTEERPRTPPAPSVPRGPGRDP